MCKILEQVVGMGEIARVNKSGSFLDGEVLQVGDLLQLKLGCRKAAAEVQVRAWGAQRKERSGPTGHVWAGCLEEVVSVL